MIYYTQDEQGRINAWSDACFMFGENGDCACLTTDKEIVYGPPEADGSLVGYTKGTEPPAPPPPPPPPRAEVVAAKRAEIAAGFAAAMAATALSEQGWSSEVIERQLAHVDKNRIRAAYQRSELLAERCKMMQAWADYLDVRCAWAASESR